MKLVLVYQQTDDFTYSVEKTVPFDYQSKSKAIDDILGLVLEAVENNSLQSFKFLNTSLPMNAFGYFEEEGNKKSFEFIEPNIFTLEEWFEQYTLS